MPQTREHLAILDLLGIERALVALTKIDRVSEQRVAEVAAQIHALLAGTGLAGAKVFPVCAPAGTGIAPLRAHLEQAAAQLHRVGDEANFRLAVDRGFSITGAGQVVTGTIFSGTVRVDNTLMLSPAGAPVRVRGLQIHDRPAQSAHAGQRCALNLTGPGAEDVTRGDWVVAEPAHVSTDRLDVHLHLLASEERPLKHWTPVHLHLAAAEVSGRVALLTDRNVEPGAEALVQLVLERPISALHGDRFILRDQSAQRTLAGGAVLDPFAPTRGRARPERIALLRVLQGSDPVAALTQLLEHSPRGLDLARFARSWNLTPARAEELSRQVPMKLIGRPPSALAPRHWEALQQAVLQGLAAYHQSAPQTLGPAEQVLRKALPERIPPALFGPLLEELARQGKLVRGGLFVRLPEHQPVMAAADRALWQRLAPLLKAGGLRPPRVRELAEALNVDWKTVESLLVRAVGLGKVMRVADNRFFLPEAVQELARIAERLAAETPEQRFTAAAYRDRSGIGRNLAIQVLEFFDQAGLTRRLGNTRQIAKTAATVFGAADS